MRYLLQPLFIIGKSEIRGELMPNLNDMPKEYLAAMKNLLGDEYADYVESLNRKPFYGIRLNSLKIGKEEFLKRIQKDLREIPWIENGYYTDENDRFSKHPYYYAGLYYLQEPSAMTPASLLEIEEGDKVLDLCAAPGGKSTELGARLQGSGVLYSNDPSASRAKALLKNIELFGIGNAMLSCEDPAKLSRVYSGYFDRILVDAPCSGEGMFRKDAAVLSAYKKRGPEFFAPIQDSILKEAAKMLRPGGGLLYSTCTYSELEDEGSIERFLEGHRDFSLEEVELKEGFSPSKRLRHCIRLFPHRLEGEGHFIAKLRKSEDANEEEALMRGKGRKKGLKKPEGYFPDFKLPKDCLQFLSHIQREWDPKRFFCNREYIYYLPEHHKTDPSLHYLRTGLLLGRMRNERFEPSQALAMNLRAEEWDFPLLLSLEDERVIKYLKGETVETEEEYKGYRLLCVDRFPLGFVKQEQGRCKNKYYPGWRWN